MLKVLDQEVLAFDDLASPCSSNINLPFLLDTHLYLQVLDNMMPLSNQEYLMTLPYH